METDDSGISTDTGNPSLSEVTVTPDPEPADVSNIGAPDGNAGQGFTLGNLNFNGLGLQGSMFNSSFAPALNFNGFSMPSSGNSSFIDTLIQKGGNAALAALMESIVPGGSIAGPAALGMINGNPGTGASAIGSGLQGAAISGALGPAGFIAGLGLSAMGVPSISQDIQNSIAFQAANGLTATPQDTMNTQNANNAGGQEVDLYGLGSGLAGLYAANRQSNAYGASSDGLGSYIQSLQNMFSQDSPYAQQLRQQLERRDAAAGRRSQYGPREVELQAQLAKMNASLAPAMVSAYNQSANQSLMQQQLQNQKLNVLLGMGKSLGLDKYLQNGLSSLFGNGGSSATSPYSINYTGGSPVTSMNSDGTGLSYNGTSGLGLQMPTSGNSGLGLNYDANSFYPSSNLSSLFNW